MSPFTTPVIPALVRILLASALLVLAACGGGDGDFLPDTSLETGTFIPGPVEGLHYQTATQSGLTNAAGEFQYVEGETVTFSIGDIELGSTPGAAEISLPQLLGATLPTTGAGIREELGSYDEVTDFDRVANAAMLLMALDADGDAGNGLDLSGRHEQLAGESVNLDLNLYYFAIPSYYTSPEFRLESINNNGLLRLRNTAQIPGDIPVWAALYNLYEGLGIQVPLQVETLRERDASDDGTIDSRSTTVFNNSWFSVSYTRDTDADGNPEDEESETRDDYGRLLNRTELEDNDDDGTVDEIEQTIYTWNDTGTRAVISEEEDNNADGVADEVETETYSYDAVGNPTEIVTEEDTNGDGTPEAIETEIRTFDDEGRILTLVEEDDSDGDGSLDRRESETFTYDESGNLISEVREDDTDVNGIANTITTYTYTYDEAGNKLTEVYERINGAEVDATTVDYRRTDTYTYDGAGNQLTNVEEQDAGADGTIDDRRTITNTYDADGNWLTWIRSYDNDGDTDGNTDPDNYYETEYSYDADGNPLTFQEEYIDSAGTTRMRWHTSTYDDQGNLTEEVEEVDEADADGTVDVTETTTYVYNETGQVMSRTDETDDGVVTTGVETYSYETLDQGVMFLGYYYWD